MPRALTGDWLVASASGGPPGRRLPVAPSAASPAPPAVCAAHLVVLCQESPIHLAAQPPGCSPSLFSATYCPQQPVYWHEKRHGLRALRSSCVKASRSFVPPPMRRGRRHVPACPHDTARPPATRNVPLAVSLKESTHEREGRSACSHRGLPWRRPRFIDRGRPA